MLDTEPELGLALLTGGQRGSVQAVIAWGESHRGRRTAGDRMSGSPALLGTSWFLCCFNTQLFPPHPVCLCVSTFPAWRSPAASSGISQPFPRPPKSSGLCSFSAELLVIYRELSESQMCCGQSLCVLSGEHSLMRCSKPRVIVCVWALLLSFPAEISK